MPTKKELEERTATKGKLKVVRGFCNQCTNGPHPIDCYVVNGTLTRVDFNRELMGHTFSLEGRSLCSRLNTFVQKVYNPNRVKSPMKRTNPEKGKGVDPGWQEIGWDEALDIVGRRLRHIRQEGVRDENGHPRLAKYQGAAGTAHITGPALSIFETAWGPTDEFYASGGIRCYHTEHYYAEMWHRSWVCFPDADRVKWILSIGRNDNSNWAFTAQHVQSRAGDVRRIQLDPHLSLTTAASGEWIAIKPMTDLALLLAMTHVILYEMEWRKTCDIHFLKNMTNGPYLIGPHGYCVREPESGKPLIWDPIDRMTKGFDAEDIKDFALEGKYEVKGIEIGPDEDTWEVNEGTPSFDLLVEAMKDYNPEWASQICGVSAANIRSLAREYVQSASVGTTIDVEGKQIPFRPVFIGLGKNNSNGPGSYQLELLVHILACLVGSLEVAGGHIASSSSVPGGPLDRSPDGFLSWPSILTGRDTWVWPPDVRNGMKTLTPVIGTKISNNLGPGHLSWITTDEGGLPNWPVRVPDALISYKCNMMTNLIDPERIERVLKKVAFHVRFAYEFDETAQFADVLLPENIDIEATSVCVNNTAKYITDNLLVLGRSPVVKPFNTMDMTDICTEIAARVGILGEYNEVVNRGALSQGVPFSEADRLESDRKYTAEEIYERVVRAITKGEHSLSDLQETGGYSISYPSLRFEGVHLHGGFGGFVRPWYLYPLMVEKKMRFEFPYQERLKKMNEELARRLHEKGIYWWDKQLEEITPLPQYRDIAGIYDNGPEYDLWAVTSHSGKFPWGTVSNPLYLEMVEQSLEHLYVQINAETARQRGIRDGDEIYIESADGKVRGRAKLREGLRPDTIVLHGQFGHWATPIAKEVGEMLPSINSLSKMKLELMAEDGGVRDTVRVKVYKVKR